MSPTRRMLLLVLGVAALAGAAWLLPLRELPEAVERLGVAAPVAGAVVSALLLVALVPRTPISLACGLLFGVWVGAACALVATMIAAAVTFAAGRALGTEWVARRAGKRWAGMQTWLEREGTLAVAAVRALPLGPYGLGGYAYGASGVRVRHFALGSLIAGAPSAISYAYLGAAVARPGDLDPLTLIPLAFGMLLALGLLIRMRIVTRRRSAALADQEVGQLAGARQER